jgi:DNA modification methylase
MLIQNTDKKRKMKYIATKNNEIILINKCWEFYKSFYFCFQIDTLITDPPFSKRVFEGHNKKANMFNRQLIKYPPITKESVGLFVDNFSSIVRKWMVIITDHNSIKWYEDAFKRNNRYCFAPVPFVHSNKCPRFSGDGPASWTSWIVVARPKKKEFIGWGSLPGAYILPKGEKKSNDIIGNKHIWLMKKLINDYSRKNDVILDPFAGSATTLIAAAIKKRRGIGMEIDEETFEIAKKRIERFEFK